MTTKRFLLGMGLLLGSVTADTSPIDSLLVSADAAKGEKLAVACRACHSSTKGAPPQIGPNLYEVVGRPIASQQDFQYSDALKGLTGQWNYETLDQFLTQPAAMVPGTRMMYPGLANPGDRAAVIAWLRLLADNPEPLPQAEPSSADIEDLPENPDLALLPEGDARDDVYHTCSVCHSIKLVAQQGLDRYSWTETLNWMVEEQGMTALDAQTQERVLDYLVEHFGPDRDR